MSFGTNCPVNLYFSHKTYKYKSDAESDLEDVRENIRNIETRFAMYAAADPRMALNTKDCENNEMNPVDVLAAELRDLRDWYKEEILKEWQLEMLLDNWDARTGDFIDEDKLRKELMGEKYEN